tara:strand:+ start:7104 stop:7361 length:258 start_codon:yes stop_codon:yes gene_type:complete
MGTHFALLALYNSPYVQLKVISKEFLGITPVTAEAQAKACALPFPTCKLRASERSPTMVKVEDLAAYIDKQYQAAAQEWQSVQSN